MIEKNRVYCGHGTSAGGVLAILDRDKLLHAALADPALPTAGELREPVIAQVRLPDYMGAHTSFPILGMRLSEFANDQVIESQDFVAIVNEQTRNECTDSGPADDVHGGDHRRGTPLDDLKL